jgi:hypothetical protein
MPALNRPQACACAALVCTADVAHAAASCMGELFGRGIEWGHWLILPTLPAQASAASRRLTRNDMPQQHIMQQGPSKRQGTLLPLQHTQPVWRPQPTCLNCCASQGSQGLECTLAVFSSQLSAGTQLGTCMCEGEQRTNGDENRLSKR